MKCEYNMTIYKTNNDGDLERNNPKKRKMQDKRKTLYNELFAISTIQRLSLIARKRVSTYANFAQIERAMSTRVRKTECMSNTVTCERTSDEVDPPTTSKKSRIVRSHQQSCINRTAKETKTAGTLAVVVGGFVACWLPFFILYLATPFVSVDPPDVLMLALTWLGIYDLYTI